MSACEGGSSPFTQPKNFQFLKIALFGIVSKRLPWFCISRNFKLRTLSFFLVLPAIFRKFRFFSECAVARVYDRVR